MFDKKKPTENIVSNINRISEGTQLTGDIVSNADFRIDGTLLGSCVLKGKLVIGPKGYVEGTIKCQNIDIEGRFSGKLEAIDLLNLKSTSNVIGDVIIGKLGVEPGATFNATCVMKSAVKNINEVKNESQIEEKKAL
ncbi:polymer-forming cytoskeletal protein [uncultured Flavobacterium sp.]|uniref:bactofilin family protein n=1 Tax=uncultured Flavobacterium sp. TaxID=165435 RepID=UPI0030CA3D22